MKNYTITVNGNTYEVTVEENKEGQVASTPKAAPKTAPRPAAPKAVLSGKEGAVKVVAPMPGKILGIKVNVGAAVKKGQVLFILEAMKMENEIVAPQDGTVASVNVAAGQAVEAGNTLATLN